MKVVFVIDSLAGGGAERATVNLANGLAQDEKKEVIVFTLKKQVDEYLLDTTVKRENCLTGKYILDVKRLRKKLIEDKIDVAIGMSIYANFCLTAANFFLKTKVIISERNSPKHDHISWKSRLLRFLLYRNADNYVFQTEEAKNFYSKRIQRRGRIIPNPVRTDIPFKTDAEKKEIIAIGRLMPQKNYPLLLNAFAEVHAKYPEYILRVFGQGKELKNLEDIVTGLGISNAVKFEGFCFDIHEKIKDASIFVMSSDFEGMPNSLMEAMAMGFPVVCTDCPVGGPSALIQSGENGVLVPVGDVEQLSKAILMLIENDYIRSMIAERAKKIRETNNVGAVIKMWEKIIEADL